MTRALKARRSGCAALRSRQLRFRAYPHRVKIALGARRPLAVGAGYGLATALGNWLASLFGPLGVRPAGTGWSWVAQIPSILLDTGWAWAGVAVVAGWVVRGRFRGAAAGASALLVATATYYLTGCLLEGASPAWYSGEIRYWSYVSAVCGAALGVVGASTRRPGATGLLSGLIVPLGAAVQMAVLPPSAGAPIVTPAMMWAPFIVWTAAAAAIGLVVARFVQTRRTTIRFRSATVSSSSMSTAPAMTSAAASVRSARASTQV